MTIPEGPPAGPTASELHPRLAQRALSPGALGTGTAVAAELTLIQDALDALTTTVENMPPPGMKITTDSDKRDNIAVLGDDDGIYVPPDVMVISDDDGNIAVLGSDEGIYVPDTITASTAVGDSGWHYANAPGEPRTGPNYDYDYLGGSWGPIRWRRDAGGCVFMEGLLGPNIATSVDVPFITLPEGFRPAYELNFAVVGAGTAPYKFVLEPNGDLYYAWEDPGTPSGAFGSLAGMTWMAEDIPNAPVWMPLPLTNGWSNYGPDNPPARYYIDNVGDVHLSGLIKGGATGTIATLPKGAYDPNNTIMFCQICAGYGTTCRIDIQTGGGINLASYAGGGTNDWVSLDGIVISNPNGVWATPSLTNGWTEFDTNPGGWAPFSFSTNANGVVSMRGLIKGGTVTVPTTLATTPFSVSATPMHQLAFLCAANGGAARIDVTWNNSLNFAGFFYTGNNAFLATQGRWFARAEGKGATGSPGAQGIQGEPGLGVPPGGQPGTVLTKVSTKDNDTAWSVPSSGGSGTYSLDSGWHYIGAAGEPPWYYGGLFDPTGTAYGTGRFRRDGAGCVWIDLLFGNYAPNQSTPIFQLPPGFRPATLKMFLVLVGNGSTLGQVIINSQGQVFYWAGPSPANWVNFGNVTFMADDSPLTVTYQPLTLQNGWTNYGNGYAPARYYTDSAGDIHLSGMIGGGSIAPGTVLFSTGTAWDYGTIYQVACSGTASTTLRLDLLTNGNVVINGNNVGATNAWLSLDGIVLSNPGGTWYRPVVNGNSWSNYGSTWAPLGISYNKYGVASMRGVLQPGAVTIPAVFCTPGTIPGKASPRSQTLLLASSGTGSANQFAAARIDVVPDGSLQFLGFFGGGGNQYVGVQGRWFVSAEGVSGIPGPPGLQGAAGPQGPAGAAGAPGSGVTGVTDGRQVALDLTSGILRADLHQYADHVLGNSWNNTRANGYYWSSYSDPNYANAPTNANYMGVVMVMSDNYIVQRAWNMDMPNTVTPTEYTRTWKPNGANSSWSAWVMVGGEPISVELIVSTQQVVTGPGPIRPDMTEYHDSLWTSDNTAFYTVQTGVNNTAVRILQDGTYSISGTQKVAQSGGMSMFISSYTTWDNAGRRVLAHTSAAPNLWEISASTVARLPAGILVDLQVNVPTGSNTFYRDSHGGGLVGDAANLVIVKL